MPRPRSIQVSVRPQALLLAGLALAGGLSLGGCRSATGRDIQSPGDGSGNAAPVSSTLVAAQAEIANSTSETATPRDTTTISSREDNPETSTPVAVTF